jgi:23S rRNA pseudouridine1911/1915/1917 synthase
MNDGYIYSEVLGADAVDVTVLAYMVRVHRHSDDATWAARIAAGEVFVDNLPATTTTTLRQGQRLDWHKPPWLEPDAPMDVDVLFDDDDLIAVCKPAGLPTLPGSGYLQHTVLAIVRAMAKTASPVHRLDRGTSGVVLFVKHATAARHVQRQWDTQGVTKVYRALVEGIVVDDDVVIEAPIGPMPDVCGGALFVAVASGKRAKSTLRVVERRAATTLCNVQIETGRPHQIRIHAGVIGHPLVDDPVYGVGGVRRVGSLARPGESGALLHAHTLTLAHPRTEERLTVVAPPPSLLSPSR